MIRLATSKGFAEGIRLFNQGNFFAAHEVWEQEWKIAEGEEKVFYQAMIQAAAALLHIQRSNYAGAVSVYLKSWAKLAQFPEVWMGIELAQFRSELGQYFAPFRDGSIAGSGNFRSAAPDRTAGIAPLPVIRWSPA